MTRKVRQSTGTERKTTARSTPADVGEQDAAARQWQRFRAMRSRQFREALSPFWAWRISHR